LEAGDKDWAERCTTKVLWDKLAAPEKERFCRSGVGTVEVKMREDKRRKVATGYARGEILIRGSVEKELGHKKVGDRGGENRGEN